MRQTFWTNRRVLITGHTGFKGSWLALWLQRMGAKVTGFGLPAPTHPSLFEAAEVACGMTSIMGDVRDVDALTRVFQQHRPEVILHLAAQSLVRPSYESPVDTYSVNVMGTVHVLEAARHTPGVRSIVIVTSDKCYANREWVWGYRETEPMGGHDPYSSSKGCAELVTSAYGASYFSPAAYGSHGIAVATARAGNVIGGGDWAKDRLLPDIVRSLKSGRPIVIRNPDAVRPWQHVLEPIRGYLDLARALLETGPEFSGGWNFGPAAEDARPVTWVAAHAASAWGAGAQWEVEKHSGPHEANCLTLDTSKARALLGWTPILRLPESLASTVAWYRDFYRKCEGGQASARPLVTREIARYEEALQ